MLKSGLIIIAALALGACVVAPVPPPRYVGEPAMVVPPPPPPRVEIIGVAPGPGYVWIGGAWRWGGARYYWAPGYWGPPRHGYRW